jgi:hypothetical protein
MAQKLQYEWAAWQYKTGSIKGSIEKYVKWIH